MQAVQLKRTTEYDILSHLIEICVAILYIMFSNVNSCTGVNK